MRWSFIAERDIGGSGGGILIEDMSDELCVLEGVRVVVT